MLPRSGRLFHSSEVPPLPRFITTGAVFGTLFSVTAMEISGSKATGFSRYFSRYGRITSGGETSTGTHFEVRIISAVGGIAIDPRVKRNMETAEARRKTR